MTPQDVRTATAADREAILDTLVLSFSGDPCARFVWPNSGAFMAGWRHFVMAMGGRAFDHGTAFVTEDHAAAALWLPPGVKSDGEALGALVEGSAPEARKATLAQVGEQMEEAHPQEPHWYLALVGCDPAHQGRGLGSLLIEEGLRRCDEQGLPAYLESSNPKNIPLYERHGFEVIGQVRPDDFPGVYPMLRPAR